MLSEGWSQDFPFTNIRGVEGVPHDVPYDGYLVHARSAWKSSVMSASALMTVVTVVGAVMRLMRAGHEHKKT